MLRLRPCGFEGAARVRLRSAFRGAVLSPILLLALGAPASADVRFEMGHCDTIRSSPLQIRSEFAIQNLGDSNICEFVLTRLLEHSELDSCYVADAGGPPGWAYCTVPGGAGWHASYSYPAGYQGCIGPGERLDGLSIVLEPVVCIHLGLFFDELGDYDLALASFPCDAPVQFPATTWGRVKAIYR